MLDERWADGVVSRVPQLARGVVWCITCGRSQDVDAARSLLRGWPRCCRCARSGRGTRSGGSGNDEHMRGEGHQHK